MAISHYNASAPPVPGHLNREAQLRVLLLEGEAVASERKTRTGVKGTAGRAVRIGPPLFIAAGDLAELLDAVHMPRPPADLAVGGRLKSETLLQRDGVAERAVLHASQGVGVDSFCGEVGAGTQQFSGAQQAAHVVSAKWWAGSCGHDDDGTG